MIRQLHHPRFHSSLRPSRKEWAAVLAGILLLSVFVTPAAHAANGVASPAAAPSNSILFVTQVPVPADFTTIAAVFGNHQARITDVARGGDLYIRYPNGALRNLTREAGYGNAGQQGANAIAVRDPSLHWSGQKAVFSMVVGAPTAQYRSETYYWQLYEISGFGIGETVVITKVPNQPANFNNISPIYGTDERIIFTTDRPRNGALHLYPQRDEYELAPTVSGLWSLDPATGDLFLLDHSPSGDFTPILDSFGRVVFTRWDHLQRDQQADGDAHTTCGNADFGTFNYSDESAAATFNLNNPDRTEVFPEPRTCRTDLLAGTHLIGQNMNQFFPWAVNEDGTSAETLNHIGRHELLSYFDASFDNDDDLIYCCGTYPRFNPNSADRFLQIKEDPAHPGTYYGTHAPEFGTHASGQVISVTAPPTQTADTIAVAYLTHPDTANADDAPTANHSGLYRDPLPMSDGALVVAHTWNTQEDANTGSREFPASRYGFRLKQIDKTGQAGPYWTPIMTLTNGISATVTYWDPDVLVTYSGNLWELNPVEVRPRAKPARLVTPLLSPEAQAFAAAGVTPAAFRAWLQQNNLALSVTRNVTTRDIQDKQQPINLKVPGGVQTIGTSGKVYDVQFLQYFQADQLRGFTGCCSNEPNPGRRVLARPLHDPAAMSNNPPSTGPTGTVTIAPDGSQAAFVPARRAMSWQLTDASGTGVVRERYWLTFQPGEIRVCGSCHGLNTRDQASQGEPMNSPQALLQLLQYWKAQQGPGEPGEPVVRDKFVYMPTLVR